MKEARASATDVSSGSAGLVETLHDNLPVTPDSLHRAFSLPSVPGANTQPAPGEGGQTASTQGDSLPPFTLLIPARDGDSRVGATVAQFSAAVQEWGNRCEILVVTDGRSAPEQLTAYPRMLVRHVFLPELLGKGGAILKGIGLAQYDTVALMDADGPVSPDQLQLILSRLDGCAAVVGSRRAPGSLLLAPGPGVRRVASRGFNSLVRLVLRIPQSDTQCGVKVLKRSSVRSLLSRVAVWGFAFDASLLFHLHAAGLPVREVGVEWHHRDGSTVRLRRVVPKMFVSVLGIRLRNSPFGKYLPSDLVQTVRHWLNSP